jgi:hypothetical protein
MSHRFDPSRVALVLTYLKANPTHGERRVSTALGISRPAASRIIAAYRAGRLNASAILVQTAPTDAPSPGIRSDSGANTHEIVSKNPRTLADLVKVCEVDLKVWRIARHVVNKWEVGVKQDDGTVLTSPLFQIKVWLEPLPGQQIAEALKEVIREISKGVRLPDVMSPAKKAVSVEDPHMLELSLPDIHVGKLAWSPEVGEDYDIKIAPTLAMQAARALLCKASVFPLQSILLPLGNDYFNVNNAAGTTQGGTPQDEDGRWKKTFKIGIRLAVDLIELCRGKTPGGVDVILVPGNHDPERLYYLGEVLQGIYGKTPDVRINNGEKSRKYFRFGTTLLGFTHGHGEKHDRLPLIMAGEKAQDWAETTHHEWHLGHLHHKRETRYVAGNEFGPVRVRILPSLCPADEWHFGAGYVGSKRAAEAYLWSFNRGYTGHLSWSPTPALQAA